MARFSIEATFSGTDKVSKFIDKIEGKTKGFASGLGASLKAVDGWNDKVLGGFASVASKAAAVGAVVGGAIAAIAGHMIHTGAEFEQSITNVGAVMGKTRSQIGDLEKSAMSLGVTTQFSSSQVAEAMEFMARKGFDAEEILQGIPGVLNAVAASGEGMAEVATVVGSSIRGFGLEAKDAGYVANLLAFTAEKTGAKITDMGTALAIAAPTAKALGVSIDDTAAAVGLLQKTGIDSSTAGSAVATMLAKISHPSSEAAGKMAAMGIKFKDAKGDMLSFRDVLGQFVKAGDKAGGNMDKMSFFAELVGLRGDKAALGLERMAKSGEFDKLLSSLKNTGNYAEKVAQIRLDTTEGSWKLLLSTIEVIETKLFNLVGGSLRNVIDATNKWLGTDQDLKITGYIEKARFALDLFASGARMGFGVVAEAFAPVVWLFGVFADRIKDSGTWPGKVQAIGEAFGFVGAVGVAFVAFAASVKIARGAVIAYEAAVAIA
jgi:TP901 family phage tail tape measure protein